MSLPSASLLSSRLSEFLVIRGIYSASYPLQVPDKRGGLNGSTQHQLKVHVRESTKLNWSRGVDVNGRLPCLGSD